MKWNFVAWAWCALLVLHASWAAAQQNDPLPDSDNRCISCHGLEDLWEAPQLHLYVSPEHLAGDIHWRKGLKCHECHGGDPRSTDVREAHAIENGFQKIASKRDEPAFCARCHADAAKMADYQQPSARIDVVDLFWNSAHGQVLKNAADPTAESLANCSSCHPKHGILPATDPLSATHPLKLSETCGKCHQDQRQLLLIDAHRNVSAESNGEPRQGSGQVSDVTASGRGMDCLACHQGDVHSILPVKDTKSSVFLDNQVQSCGHCHQKELKEYHDSVHGQALTKLGLLVTASCSDCHGAHGIFPNEDSRSSLSQGNVSETCGSCHRFIDDRLQASVHGNGFSINPLADHPTVNEEKQKPTCIACHQGHDLQDPTSMGFRLGSSDRCGDCHEDMHTRYAMGIHGQLAELGFAPAARCSDCHGAHSILPVNDPHSQVATGDNRLETCQKCHPKATLNFTSFDPHADHHDAEAYPLLYYANFAMETLLVSVFIFFGVHTLLWFVRSIVHTARHGRAKRPGPNQKGYVRFITIHRVLHAIMIVSFLGLAVTGLPLKYSQQEWAKTMASAMGGFGTTGTWHHIFGVITFGYFAAHLIWLSGQIVKLRREGVSYRKIFFGPDSMVPVLRDIADMFGMFRWFFGLGKKPSFDRWTYWEKFDYWAVFWGVGIIGVSGMMLWLPELFCIVLPGYTLNVAKVIHSEEALLATGFIFAIHFFNTHLRAEKFPMDMSMLTGMVSDEEMYEERPDYVRRLREAGGLEGLKAEGPTRFAWWLMFVGGAIALTIGTAMLIAILVSIF